MEKTKEEIKEEIEKDIKDSVDDFIGTIKKEPCCEYFSDKTEVDWKCEKVYKDALYQGYLDACRTIHWSTKAREDGDGLLKRKKVWDKKRPNTEENPMRKPLTTVAQELCNYFNGDEKFDDKYSDWCEALIDSYKKYLSDGITYGQAQKIINMAFKYLYCICDRCGGGEKYKKKFDKCHMPLDSFSLEWFKRKFKEDDFSNAESYPENYKKLPENLFTKGEKKKLKAESIGSWSSMQKTWEKSCIKEEYPYEFYAHVIKKYCKENSITPLQLDFIVWSKMQKIMAAESFIKTFKDDDKENKEAINSEEQEPYDILNLKTTLENRLSEIRPLICK